MMSGTGSPETRGADAATVAIVVVTYNSAEFIEKCIGSLIENAPRRRHRLIVVDNASSDGTAAIVRSSFPQVELLELGENVGFGRGNNAGFERIPADFYYCHNADAYLQANVIDQALDVMDADETIGIAGLRLVYPDLSPQTSAYSASTPAKWLLQGLKIDTAVKKLISVDKGGYFSGALAKTRMGNSFVRTHTQNRSDQNRKRVADVDWVCGASLIIRGSALAQLAPGFDPDIFLYGEDEDICLRARRKGWRVVQIDTTPVIHEFGWGKSVRSSAHVVDLKFQGLKTFIDKNFAEKPLSRAAMHTLLRIKHAFWRAKASRG